MTSADRPASRTPEALNTCGNELVRLGKFVEAIAHYQEALRLRPDFAIAHNNLANALSQQGKFDVAVDHYQAAIRLRPGLTGAHDNLGVALKALGKTEEARASFLEALRLQPDFVEAHLNLADLLASQGNLNEAVESLQRAVRLSPTLPKAHHNLGFVFAQLGRLDEALACYREALHLKSDYAELLPNLGNTLRDLGRIHEAEACYRDAVRLFPNSAGSHNNLGNILADQGQFDAAQACYLEAVRLNPEYVEAHTNRAHAYLASGDYLRGFLEYEWRLRSKTHATNSSLGPRWRGESLSGKTILIRTEQGFGDTFQFLRYLTLVKERGGRLLLECEPPLVELLSRLSALDRIIPLGSPLPRFDVQCSLLSLPAIFGTALDTVPAKIPYLFPCPELTQRWQAELSMDQGFKVGIAWQGNPKHKRDRFRSIPLRQFRPLAEVPGVRLISLQQGPGTDQLTGISETFSVLKIGPAPEKAQRTFCDTAAIIQGLDLIITVDTAIAHLAGALGVPVWVALPLIPDWRWMRDRDDTPWYPSMRLYRQSAMNHWDDVIRRMAGSFPL